MKQQPLQSLIQESYFGENGSFSMKMFIDTEKGKLSASASVAFDKAENAAEYLNAVRLFNGIEEGQFSINDMETGPFKALPDSNELPESVYSFWGMVVALEKLLSLTFDIHVEVDEKTGWMVEILYQGLIKGKAIKFPDKITALNGSPEFKQTFEPGQIIRMIAPLVYSMKIFDKELRVVGVVGLYNAHVKALEEIENDSDKQECKISFEDSDEAFTSILFLGLEDHQEVTEDSFVEDYGAKLENPVDIKIPSGILHL